MSFFFLFFLFGDYEVYGQPAAAKEIPNYKSALLSMLASKMKEVFFLHFLDFSLFFLNCSRSVSRVQLETPLKKHLCFCNKNL